MMKIHRHPVRWARPFICINFVKLVSASPGPMSGPHTPKAKMPAAADAKEPIK